MIIPDTDYRIVKMSDDNVADLVTIYKDAVDDNVDENYFIQKFNTSYTGHKNVGFIAYSPEGEPAAFYGVLPCFMNYNGEKILVAQSGNTMTHKKHRRKKLFVILALKTFEYSKSIGIQLVFGFPNEFSYPGFVRQLDWTHKENIQAYITKTKCIPMLRIKSLLKKSNEWHVRYASKILIQAKKGKPFSKSIQDNGKDFTMDRSEDFFNYKTYPKKFILSILGKSVWVKISGMYLLVGDIESCSEKEFKKIIKKLHTWCFWMGIPHLRFHTSPNSQLEKYLIPIANKHDSSYPIGFIQLTGNTIKMEKVKFTLADYDTF